MEEEQVSNRNHPMYKHIEVIKNFMTIDSVDFALMLDGKWGSGKTFFRKQ